jgi:hypothetical protein
LGLEYVYTNDGDTNQWVEVAAGGGFLGPIGYSGSAGNVMAQGAIGFTGSAGFSDYMSVALSDEYSPLVSGTAVTFRVPYALTLTQLPRASLTTAGGSVVTVDINKNGTSVLGTKLTIDASEKTSTTAATPATLVTTSFADDDEVTLDIDTIGAGATGVKVTIYYRKV